MGSSKLREGGLGYGGYGGTWARYVSFVGLAPARPACPHQFPTGRAWGTPSMGGGNYGDEGGTQNPGTVSQRVTTGGGGSLLSCAAPAWRYVRGGRTIGRGAAPVLGRLHPVSQVWSATISKRRLVPCPSDVPSGASRSPCGFPFVSWMGPAVTRGGGGGLRDDGSCLWIPIRLWGYSRRHSWPITRDLLQAKLETRSKAAAQASGRNVRSPCLREVPPPLKH